MVCTRLVQLGFFLIDGDYISYVVVVIYTEQQQGC